MTEKVILVDQYDKEIGTEEKVKAHKSGKLHRAFSIFVFNSKGELLLQKRAKTKYHSGGLWSNTCCSHPGIGETNELAAHRRLKEELGFNCDLKEVFSVTYNAKLAGNLLENECDHVFIGIYGGKIDPNPEEVSDWKYVRLNELQKNMQEFSDEYTYWLRIIFPKLILFLEKSKPDISNSPHL
ncbi:MAG: isopentenyl-diphosphate Delta-isomerase [Dehalococcoidales bacterium]|nr:isopentenyl-diphosphate Delta-isomerase [Dehalococcoidales bacterium]